MSVKRSGRMSRGNVLVEFCMGTVAVLLVAGIFLYLALAPAQPVEKVPVAENDARKEERYEALLQEKGDLEKYMEARPDEKDDKKWLVHKDPMEEERECGFAAYVSQTSGDVYGRVMVDFVHSEDVSVDRIVVVADGEERTITLGDAGRETVSLDDGDVSEIVELPIGDYLPIFKRMAISDNVILRFQGEGGEFERELTGAQIRNFDRTLRLYEVEREIAGGAD